MVFISFAVQRVVDFLPIRQELQSVAYELGDVCSDSEHSKGFCHGFCCCCIPVRKKAEINKRRGGR
jgi:hypothetical protein